VGWVNGVHCRQLAPWLTAKPLPGPTCQHFAVSQPYALPSAGWRLTAKPWPNGHWHSPDYTGCRHVSALPSAC
jgi:hypothetical protein